MSLFLQIRIFTEIVRAGSITGAADQLQIAKSAVSRRLQELEARLGVQLMVRTTRQLNLTEAGEIFYERCLNVLAELEAAEDAVSETGRALHGELRITAPESYGLKHVVPVVLQFMNQYPQMLINLDLTDRFVDIAREGFDLAIRVGSLQDSTLRARRLSKVSLVVCASPDYFSRYGVPDTPDGLEQHICIRYSRLSNVHIWRYRDASGKHGQVRVPIRALSTSGDFIREAALAGIGIILTPTFLVSEALQTGRLVSVLNAYEWYESTLDQSVYAVFPPGRHKSRRVRTFTEFLAQRLSS